MINGAIILAAAIPVVTSRVGPIPKLMYSGPNRNGTVIAATCIVEVDIVTAFVRCERGTTRGSIAGRAELPSMFTIPVNPVTTQICHGASTSPNARIVSTSSDRNDTDCVIAISTFRFITSASAPP